MKLTPELLLKIITPLIAVAIAYGVIETKIEHFDTRITKVEDKIEQLDETFVKIEIRLAEIQKDIQALNNKLDEVK